MNRLYATRTEGHEASASCMPFGILGAWKRQPSGRWLQE